MKIKVRDVNPEILNLFIRPKNSRETKIRFLKEHGCTNREIAKDFKITHQRVAQILKQDWINYQITDCVLDVFSNYCAVQHTLEMLKPL